MRTNKVKSEHPFEFESFLLVIDCDFVLFDHMSSHPLGLPTPGATGAPTVFPFQAPSVTSFLPSLRFPSAGRLTSLRGLG